MEKLTTIPPTVPFTYGESPSSPPEGFLFWSGKCQIPAIGDRVEMLFNQWGKGEVVGYVSLDGFLGCQVKVDKTPDWFLEQRKRQLKASKCKPFPGEDAAKAPLPYDGTATAFGAEILYPI